MSCSHSLQTTASLLSFFAASKNVPFATIVDDAQRVGLLDVRLERGQKVAETPCVQHLAALIQGGYLDLVDCDLSPLSATMSNLTVSEEVVRQVSSAMPLCEPSDAIVAAVLLLPSFVSTDGPMLLNCDAAVTSLRGRLDKCASADEARSTAGIWLLQHMDAAAIAVEWLRRIDAQVRLLNIVAVVLDTRKSTILTSSKKPGAAATPSPIVAGALRSLATALAVVNDKLNALLAVKAVLLVALDAATHALTSATATWPGKELIDHSRETPQSMLSQSKQNPPTITGLLCSGAVLLDRVAQIVGSDPPGCGPATATAAVKPVKGPTAATTAKSWRRDGDGGGDDSTTSLGAPTVVSSQSDASSAAHAANDPLLEKRGDIALPFLVPVLHAAGALANGGAPLSFAFGLTSFNRLASLSGTTSTAGHGSDVLLQAGSPPSPSGSLASSGSRSHLRTLLSAAPEAPVPGVGCERVPSGVVETTIGGTLRPTILSPFAAFARLPPPIPATPMRGELRSAVLFSIGSAAIACGSASVESGPGGLEVRSTINSKGGALPTIFDASRDNLATFFRDATRVKIATPSSTEAAAAALTSASLWRMYFQMGFVDNALVAATASKNKEFTVQLLVAMRTFEKTVLAQPDFGAATEAHHVSAAQAAVAVGLTVSKSMDSLRLKPPSKLSFSGVIELLGSHAQSEPEFHVFQKLSTASPAVLDDHHVNRFATLAIQSIDRVPEARQPYVAKMLSLTLTNLVIRKLITSKEVFAEMAAFATRFSAVSDCTTLYAELRKRLSASDK